MRKLIVAATVGLTLGVAGASGPDETSPEGRAYMGFSFGGEKTAPRDLHYGLRFDQDSRLIEGTTPPVMQFDFTPRGFNDARVNGLSIIKQKYRLHQDEETGGEEAVEETGFFEGMWNGVTGFFGGLFGGDDEEETAEGESEGEGTEEAAADDVPPEDLAEGAFMGYNAIDWATLAVGAVGLGFVASEVGQADEDPNPPQAGNGGGPNGDTGCTPEGCLPTGGSPLAGNTPIGTPYLGHFKFSNEVRERVEWLDGGTGQMGDLEPQD